MCVYIYIYMYMFLNMIFEKNSLDKSCSKLLAYVFAYVSGGASYVFAYDFLHAQLFLLSAAASFDAWLLVPIGFQYGFLICW